MCLDNSHSDVFVDITPKARVTEAKINKWDYIKLSSCCRAKRTIKKRKKKRQPTEWEKIFPNYISDEELIPKIHKELIQCNSKKSNNLIFKMGRGTKQTFFQRRHSWPVGI